MSQAPNPTNGISPRVLIAEDDETASRQLKYFLEERIPLRVTAASDGNKALKALSEHFHSLVLTDLHMPGIDGLKLIREMHKEHIDVPVIVMTGQGSIDSAVEVMRAGADDFFTKPLNLDRLVKVVSRILNERKLLDEVVYSREQLSMRDAFAEVLTKSPSMLAILELVGHVAQTNATVLIEGETGTGKEMIARAIHRASAGHRPGVLVGVNCAALPENLLESELFGHEKGSFTGANGQRVGRFEQAHLGTLFLDEIGDIPLSMQVKLLRALQERRFERVGGSNPVEVDVRLIAATNRSLARQVKKGTFREDLYYRVNVVRIEIPPLRDRTEDIPILVAHFCEKFRRSGEPAKEVAPDAMKLLIAHSWPGNVRELENVVERACVTCQEAVIDRRHLAADLAAATRTRVPFAVEIDRPLPELLREYVASIESRYIRKALARTHGHVGQCARICGLSRRSITSKLAEYGIDREELRRD